MLRRNILQPRTPHRSRAQHNLTRPRIKRLQKLDNPAHRIRRQQTQINYHFEIVGDELERFLGCGDGEIGSVFDFEVFRGRRGGGCGWERGGGTRGGRTRGGAGRGRTGAEAVCVGSGSEGGGGRGNGGGGQKRRR